VGRLAFGLVFLGLGVVQLARRRQQNLPWIG
jgi:hypothetical protein